MNKGYLVFIKRNMIQKRRALIINFFLSAQNYKFYCMEPEPSGADPIWSEPEPLKKVAAPLRGGYRGEAKLAQ